MHTTKRLWGLGLIAILVAACSTTGGEASPASPSIASEPPVSEAPVSEAPSAEADICTAAEMPTVTPGTFTIGTDNPAFPPYFESGRCTRPTRGSWATRRPATASRAPSPTRSPRSSASTVRQVTWIVVPFANSYAPGDKAVRRRHQPDLVHPRAGPERRHVRRLLLRQPVRRRQERTRRPPRRPR